MSADGTVIDGIGCLFGIFDDREAPIPSFLKPEQLSVEDSQAGSSVN